MRLVTLLTASLIGLVGGSASGQTPDSLPFGQYVRVTDGGAWQYGTLEHAADSLILRGRISHGGGEDRVALSLSSMHRMQTWTGRRGHAFTDFLIGGAAGALASVQFANRVRPLGMRRPSGAAFLGGFFGGTILGGLALRRSEFTGSGTMLIERFLRVLIINFRLSRD